MAANESNEDAAEPRDTVANSSEEIVAIPSEEIALDHDPEARRKIVNRLKRANGQLAGTINLIENGGHCREVVQQLAAVSKAIDRAGFLVIATAMRECMLDEGENAEDNRENLEKMFLSLA